MTSTFKPDNYEGLLRESLPLKHLQPMQVFDRSTTGFASSDPALRMKGRTLEAEVGGAADRVSLLAERRQAEDEERENALANIKH